MKEQTMQVTFENLDSVVAALRTERKLDVYVDGWDIVKFQPSHDAKYSNRGIVRNGQYGYVTRYAPDANGTWNIQGINHNAKR